MILGISADAALLFATLAHTCQTLMTLFVGSISLNAIFIQTKSKSESTQ